MPITGLLLPRPCRAPAAVEGHLEIDLAPLEGPPRPEAAAAGEVEELHGVAQLHEPKGR